VPEEKTKKQKTNFRMIKTSQMGWVGMYHTQERWKIYTHS